MTHILFLHHSVGRGILRHGQVRQRMAVLPGGESVRLWDHDYNWRGVCGPDGRRTEDALPVPDNDTTPVGYLNLFTGVRSSPGLVRRLSRYETIVFKSCFPNSRIESEAALDRLKDAYIGISEALRGLGVRSGVITTPPVRAGRIVPEQARRAAELATWLATSGPFDGVFDLFAELADIDPTSARYGMLRAENANHFVIDSHPRIRSSRRLGDPLARFLVGIATPAARP